MTAPGAISRATAPRRGRSRVAFAREVLRSQQAMGAIAPTARLAARRLAAVIPARYNGVVVELGAGTGAISAAIGEQLAPAARHIAVERDADMLAALARTAPWADALHGDAADLQRLLGDPRPGTVGVVLSSLPWSNFGRALQSSILDQVCRVLEPNGVFATIVYRPTRMRAQARQFQSTLRASFEETIETATVWQNLPPARLEICRRPRAARSNESCPS